MKDSYKKDSMLTGYLAAAIWAGFSLQGDRYNLIHPGGRHYNEY